MKKRILFCSHHRDTRVCIGLLCRNKDIRIITLSEASRCFDVSIEFQIMQSNDAVKEGMRFLIWSVACFKLAYSSRTL